MSTITAIILTYNEEMHIERCIKSLQSFCTRICVIDSYSTDRTVEMVRSLGAEVFQHTWENNYAKQLNWGIQNCQISTDWTLRIDADEYFPIELQKEISSKMDNLKPSVFGVQLNRRVIFKNHLIRFGGFKEFQLLRIWRTGHGVCEQRLMDEHIILDGGEVVSFQHYLVDENLNSMHWWVQKHNNYARREAADALNLAYHLMETTDLSEKAGVKQAKFHRFLKNQVYQKLPLGIRPVLYFLYRFIFRLGFLDHPKVWIFHFMQGLWYRLLVDITINEVEKRTQGDVEQIRNIILNEWNIRFED
ncbi:glycosyltransferase family 2 protein [Aquirufa sp. ROCK2-A2]